VSDHPFSLNATHPILLLEFCRDPNIEAQHAIEAQRLRASRYTETVDIQAEMRQAKANYEALEAYKQEFAEAPAPVEPTLDLSNSSSATCIPPAKRLRQTPLCAHTREHLRDYIALKMSLRTERKLEEFRSKSGSDIPGVATFTVRALANTGKFLTIAKYVVEQEASKKSRQPLHAANNDKNHLMFRSTKCEKSARDAKAHQLIGLAVRELVKDGIFVESTSEPMSAHCPEIFQFVCPETMASAIMARLRESYYGRSTKDIEEWAKSDERWCQAILAHPCLVEDALRLLKEGGHIQWCSRNNSWLQVL